jgi:deazaflavin-dependent oxidoreductase (nitroreductase family)
MHTSNPQVISAPLAPTRAVAVLRRVAGPIWLRMGVTAVLEVRGRRTGAPFNVTLLPVAVDGTWYLVSFGGATDWVRNLRAAARGELRRRGRAEAFTAVEVDGNERDRVIAAYLARMGPVKRSLDPVKRDFDRLLDAADHPTFRVEPIR